jgi:hypothetical protein
MVKSVLYICLIFGAIQLRAAEPVRGLGFAAGQLSGLGLSYRTMGEKYGFQVTFGALSLKQGDERGDNYQGDFDPQYWQPSTIPFSQKDRVRETDANLGLLIFKVLHSAKWSTFYAFTGASIFYQHETFEEYEYQYRIYDNKSYIIDELSGPRNSSESTSTIYGGVGIGIEIKFTQNIRLGVEWPLTLSSEGDFIMYIPQTGLHYFF